MEISLSQDAAVALSVVHRSVGRVNVYQGMQALLNIYACAESESATHYHSYLATIDFFEDFKLFLYRQSRCHYHNLLCRHSLLNQFFTNILIEIESAVFIAVVVSKDCYRAVVTLTILERAECLPHSFVGLAVRVVIRVCLNKTGVNGCGLGYAVADERYMTVPFLLLAAHVLKAVKFRLDVKHNASQGASLRQEDVGRFAALDFWYLVLHGSGLACQYGVCNTRPYTHEFGEIDVSGKAVVLFELAAGRKFEHVLKVAEVAHEVVEVVDVVLAHCILRH